MLEPHSRGVIVVSPSDTGIRQARAKTDRLDARALAKRLWVGQLDAVWRPDERIRAMRRRLARQERDPCRAPLLPQGAPAGVRPVRRQGQALAAGSRSSRSPSARQSTRRCARSSSSTARSPPLRALIAAEALFWPEVKRLINSAGGQRDRRRDVHGGDRRHRTFRGPAQADWLPRSRSARPSIRWRTRWATATSRSRGSASARHALVEASWSTVRQPGPIAGF
jgi:hypothetical protein